MKARNPQLGNECLHLWPLHDGTITIHSSFSNKHQSVGEGLWLHSLDEATKEVESGKDCFHCKNEFWETSCIGSQVRTPSRWPFVVRPSRIFESGFGEGPGLAPPVIFTWLERAGHNLTGVLRGMSWAPVSKAFEQTLWCLGRGTLHQGRHAATLKNWYVTYVPNKSAEFKECERHSQVRHCMHCVCEFVLAFRSYSWSMSKPGTIYSPAGDDGSDVNVHYIKNAYINTHVVQFHIYISWNMAHGHPTQRKETSAIAQK